MITPGSRFAVSRVPLDRIVVTMRERRYPERVAAYYRALTNPESDDHDVVIHLAPQENGTFRVLDGHHRFIASLMAGREDILALIIVERGQPGYEALDDIRVPVWALASC